MPELSKPVSADDWRLWMWVTVVALVSLGLSRAFACVTPFAAIAAFGACTLPRRQAAVLALSMWLGNQVIGFGLLHYPQNASTVGWGAAIGAASLAALGAAWAVPATRLPNGMPRLSFAFAAAYLSYEGVLMAATLILPSGSASFSPAVFLRVLLINAVAFGLLTTVERLAVAAGLPRRTGARPASA